MTERIGAAALRFYLAAIFGVGGLAADAAADVADMLVWAELRGIGSHGVLRVPRYLEMIQTGEMDPAAIPEVTQPAGAVFRIDARRAPGAVTMKQAADLAVDVARRQGTCFGVVVNTTHAGAIGMHAERIARGGMAAIVSTSGPAIMAYHGAAAPSLATSPIAIGIPGRGGPVVLDMATSVFAMGRLPALRQAGKALPPDSALSRDGTPTTDPAQAAFPLPVGGAKGSGLSFMFECLSSLIGAAPILAGQLSGRASSHSQNAFLIAVDIGAFREMSTFEADLDELSREIHALPLRAGFDEILLPGEGSGRTAVARARDGIPIAGRAWQDLFLLGGRLGVARPMVSA